MSTFLAIMAAQILDPVRIILVAIILLIIRMTTSPTKWVVPTVVAAPCISAAMVLVLEVMKEAPSSASDMMLRFALGLISTAIIVAFFRLIARPFRY